MHNRDRWIVMCLSIPLKRIFHGIWNPVETILNTCATFLLLSYSKILWVSVSLLAAVPSYNCKGHLLPNSTVLLFDPKIRLFHSKHIPYAVLAFSVILIFVLLPTLLLLLYPTRLFRKCLRQTGFKRWDILHLVMDIFQGWYKDRTENSFDYRIVSSFYVLIRIAFLFAVCSILLNEFHHYWVVIGLFHVCLGMLFLVVAPYKRKWMNHADGLMLYFIGILMIMYHHHLQQRVTFISGLVCGFLVIISAIVYTSIKCLKKTFIVFYLGYFNFC